MTRAHAIFLATQRKQLIALLAFEGGADTSSDSGGRYSHLAELYDELSLVESALDGIPYEQLTLLLSGLAVLGETGQRVAVPQTVLRNT
ncbi:hypothetical protein HDF16_001615 [Granulicella aggregans]|uniref:Uncharacterized protein n=1 Tax=Granulicella aggregans TaxID=474949 RepID=A0A7W8E496_9BACT|nr:hypothetical protein [Granulicella aggregans]